MMSEDKIKTAKLIIDYFHRTLMHHAMWFAEVQRNFGQEKAFEIMKSAYDKSYDIQVKRLAKVLNFELKDGIPNTLLEMPEDKLDELKTALATNWLTNDGVWFQAVEFSYGMEEAKKCNDSCWGQFSPFEAWSIMKYLGLQDNSGLEGLKQALEYRLYSSINKYSFHEITDKSFVFRMDDCRVQSARKRKGLEDYSCKSAGIIEYTTFAETIDKRIKTECLACPPDAHPQEFYCAWKFKSAISLHSHSESPHQEK